MHQNMSLFDQYIIGTLSLLFILFLNVEEAKCLILKVFHHCNFHCNLYKNFWCRFLTIFHGFNEHNVTHFFHPNFLSTLKVWCWHHILILLYCCYNMCTRRQCACVWQRLNYHIFEHLTCSPNLPFKSCVSLSLKIFQFTLTKIFQISILK